MSIRRAQSKPIGPLRWNWPIPHGKDFRPKWATLANPNATKCSKKHESAYESEIVAFTLSLNRLMLKSLYYLSLFNH